MWPDWIEELKRRYLAEEGSVFLLHGPGIGLVAWEHEEELLDAGRLAARFLTLSRDIVVLYEADTGRLGWGGIEDPGRFKRHTDAALVLGRKPSVNPRKPQDALGLFWLSMHTAGPNQAFIIYKTERICPERRSALEPLGMGAPPLAEWNADRALRGSDNVVLLLTGELEQVRADLREQVVLIHVPAPPKPKPVLAPSVEADPYSMRRTPISDDVARAAAEAEIEAVIASVPEEAEPTAEALEVAEAEVESAPEAAAPVPPKPAAPKHDIGALVEAALVQAVIRHGDGPPWPGQLPAREAVASVMQTLAPDRVGALTIEVADGQASAVGEGADWFNTWWAGDIAVDAACGMALSGLEKPSGGWSEEQPPRFPAAAMRALSRRIEKALR